MTATRIVAIADLHLAPPDEPPRWYHAPWDLAGAADRLAASLQLAQTQEPHLLAVLGDISQRGDHPTMSAALQTIAAAGITTRLVSGNHDCTADTSMLAGSVDQLAAPNLRIAPRNSEPLTDDLAVAGVTLDADSSGDALNGSVDVSHWGPVTVLLLSHFPLLSRRQHLAARDLKYPGDLTNHAQLAAALARRAWPTIALTAHLHVRDSTSHKSLLQLGCAAQIEPPHDATIIEVERTDDGLAVRRSSTRVATTDGDVGAALVPSKELWTYRDGEWIRRAPPGRYPGRHQTM